ncbi:hypothetical protein [Massilia scottii]|uniref:hypothetical protein n=1 Tax=Massilia scottii TaxID=3057166 RepID=UPI002796C295|nr:hypothetical protein [Massilia sp. CCM 9029]MDQ1833936.1 hypothetical protein [Massilia sp. CCM 9029]
MFPLGFTSPSLSGHARPEAQSAVIWIVRLATRLAATSLSSVSNTTGASAGTPGSAATDTGMAGKKEMNGAWSRPDRQGLSAHHGAILVVGVAA